MAVEAPPAPPPLALHIQPACLEHKYIRHANSSHIFERPERLRAVLLGFAAALARMEEADAVPDIATLLSGLSLRSAFLPPTHLSIVPPPVPPPSPGQVLLHNPAVQLAHAPPPEAPFPYLPRGMQGAAIPSSEYLRDLYKWASEAVETIKATGCEIPSDMGLNPGDLYLGPGSVLAIEGCIQTVCQAVDGVCASESPPGTPGTPTGGLSSSASKAFCAIRPPGHHCGEDEPSGFCYVNNVVVGAMHAYLEHDIDRAIIIDFDLHHGNGTQALVMPLNAASYAEDLACAAGKPPSEMQGKNGPRRGWKGFYGSVHDIYSYPCEDGDLDLIKDASVSLAAHGQFIENIHLQLYKDEADFFERIYPLYLALLDKAKVFMRETGADPERTILLISAGFDACEHEHQGMQRHDRRVPVSFYSRYTKDIAAFADEYTGGKVVSVLEGGYGDRALTSAALGHALGLLGREGDPAWWHVDELELLERAVKKRRKGKLCTLAPDLAAKPHVARAHALLSHFEGAAPPVTPTASTTATPLQQQQQRMTLRDRKSRPKLEADDGSPRPVAARRRRTPAATPADTPKREREQTPSKLRDDISQTSESTDDSLVAALAGVSLASPVREPPRIVLHPNGAGGSSQSGTQAPVMLRIPRMTPPSMEPSEATQVAQAAQPETPSQPAPATTPSHTDGWAYDAPSMAEPTRDANATLRASHSATREDARTSAPRGDGGPSGVSAGMGNGASVASATFGAGVFVARGATDRGAPPAPPAAQSFRPGTFTPGVWEEVGLPSMPMRPAHGPGMQMPAPLMQAAAQPTLAHLPRAPMAASAADVQRPSGGQSESVNGQFGRPSDQPGWSAPATVPFAVPPSAPPSVPTHPPAHPAWTPATPRPAAGPVYPPLPQRDH